jgi:diadenylate cyclase
MLASQTQSKTSPRISAPGTVAGSVSPKTPTPFSIIVSEESGIISIAVDGKLTRFLDIKTVEKTLLNIYLSQINAEKVKVPFLDLFRRRKDAEQ